MLQAVRRTDTNIKIPALQSQKERRLPGKLVPRGERIAKIATRNGSKDPTSMMKIEADHVTAWARVKFRCWHEADLRRGRCTRPPLTQSRHCTLREPEEARGPKFSVLGCGPGHDAFGLKPSRVC